MTPATQEKAAAIRAGLKTMRFDPAGLLAMLTCAIKSERETAKDGVRSIARLGQQILAAEKAAQDLANFANRNEP